MDDLPFLDMRAPGFSTRSQAVSEARDKNWCARTPFGLAVLRHRQAGALLRDRRCRQGSHDWPYKMNLVGSFADFWSRSVISVEGPEHKLQRRVAQAALAEPDILALCPTFETIADQLLKGAPDQVEFVEAFSEPFAGQAIAALLGLPPEYAPDLAKDASTLGLAMGIDAKLHEAAANAATDRLMHLSDQLLDDRIPLIAYTSFVTRLRSAAQELGLNNRQTLLDLIVISIFGGVDTTRAQLAFAVSLFIEHADTWQNIRANPDLIPGTIDEVIRHRPTTTWASRETLEDITLDGITIPAATTLHILVHATATDPLTGFETGFDPAARRKTHFGFGGGAHHCLGQFVARTDMACALRVMAARIQRFEWAGTPDYLPDSGNTSPRTLPVQMIRS